MEVLAAVDDDRLPGDEVRRGTAEVDDCADDVLRNLVALDRARSDGDVAQLKPGATQLTRTSSLPSSFASARVNATIAPFDVT
jgi:hypothetical protein